MGAAFEDVSDISELTEDVVRIRLRRPTAFAVESLEVPIRKPGSDYVGTGPFIAGIDRPVSQLKANASYFLGRPSIDEITVRTYPSIRNAWAELLRNDVDALFEVGVEALDSLERSSQIAVYTFVRRYQYLVMFNTSTPALRSPAVRRAFNDAIDRSAIVSQGLSGHGVASQGLIWPDHWAFHGQIRQSGDRHRDIAYAASQHVQFTCLVPSEDTYERIGLLVKKQLAAINVDLVLQEASPEQVLHALVDGKFEAVLLDPIGGPNLLRVYQVWHSNGPFNWHGLGDSQLDKLLDNIRHASSEDAYRSSVAVLEQDTVDNPPAIFLAWGERARAVSRRFDVPTPEKGRDVLATLRLWRPTADPRYASRN